MLFGRCPAAPSNSAALEYAENQCFNGWSLFRTGQRLNGKALSIKAFVVGRELTRAGRFSRQQAEGPDASPCGELAVGPSGGGHNSRPPPVRSNGSLCPCHLGKGFAVPHTSCSVQASVEVHSVDRYGRQSCTLSSPSLLLGTASCFAYLRAAKCSFPGTDHRFCALRAAKCRFSGTDYC